MISNRPDTFLKYSNPVIMLIHPKACILDPASLKHKTPSPLRNGGINLSVHNALTLIYRVINSIVNKIGCQ